MKNLALKKDKKTISIIVVVALLLLFLVYTLMSTSEYEDDDIPEMDFSNKKSLSDQVKANNIKNNNIVKPDPAYKEAPEFEDFQAYAKMRAHAMKPFKKETEKWEEVRGSLRIQRDRIKLFKDGAEAAKAESEMFKWREATAKYKASEGEVYEKNEVNEK